MGMIFQTRARQDRKESPAGREDTDMEQTLPEYLRRLRRACHYKQDFVAAQLHIARQTYSHYETGRIRPPAGSLYRLAGLYGVSVEDLFAHTAYGEVFCGKTGNVGSIPGSGRPGDTEKEECGPERGLEDGCEAQDREKQLLYYFRKLDERNRKDILSIIQVKVRDQEDAGALFAGRKRGNKRCRV